MPGSTNQRDTTTRRRHRAAIRRTKPDCGICHEPIDYTLPHLDPGEFVIDHIIPLARGGTDELDNVQAAHRHCNRMKSDKTAEALANQSGPRSYVTWRTW